MNGYRSGFITIVGCPNVGKSTLINALVGQKIAIVSEKAQTTRNKVTGVLSRPGYQMIFLDTPGVMRPKNKLGEYMQKVVSDSLTETEAILFVADPTMGLLDRDKDLLSQLTKLRTPLFIAINKTDIASKAQLEDMITSLTEYVKESSVLKVSAKTLDGVDRLEKELLTALPEGPQYFPDDMVTDQPERIICGEIVREKALQLLRDEVPHGIGVGVDKMELRDSGELMDVWCTIYCERESHKGIIIGRGGSMLKKIGSEARKDIEWLLGVRVNLQLWIKIKDDWRNKPAILHELGYE